MKITENTLPGISEETMRMIAPAVFAETHGMSSIYQQVRTYDVVEAFREADYFPVEAAQHKPTSRDPNHVCHKVVMRHRSYIERPDYDKDYMPQIIIINSHNGRRRLSLMAGIYRFVCENGLVIGDDILTYQSRHTGDIKEDVIKFTKTLQSELPHISDTIHRWSQVDLSPAKQSEFAREAMKLRWNSVDKYTSESVLATHREGDHGSDLWKVFNRVQERIMKGGAYSLPNPTTGRIGRSGMLGDIDKGTHFNADLWRLAEQFA